MNTATENMAKKLEAERALRNSLVWGDRVAWFVNHYAPADKYHRAEFERDFHSLLQQSFHNAQEPLLERLTRIAMSQPNPFGI